MQGGNLNQKTKTSTKISGILFSLGVDATAPFSSSLARKNAQAVCQLVIVIKIASIGMLVCLPAVLLAPYSIATTTN